MLTLYLTLLILTVILTFREIINWFFINSELFSSKSVITNSINNIFININKVLQNIISPNFIYDNGKLDVLMLFSMTCFFLLGYFQPNHYLLVIGLLTLFETTLIILKKKGRLLSLYLISLLTYTIGYRFGKKREQCKLIKNYKMNHYEIDNLPNDDNI